MMKVAFFSPMPLASNSLKSYKSSYGLTMEPELDAGFYFDLAVRSVMAVDQMMSDGSWPAAYTVTKCGDYTDTAPVARSINLLKALQVRWLTYLDKTIELQ